MDVVLLSRLQFSLTIAFHFIFVSINIGLAWLLVLVEALGWRRRDGEVYVGAAKFFGRIFAVTFVMGIATGIVMEFQFGMNWAGYSRFAGDVFGPLLAAEGLLAFFLESSFLGLYLFGRDRVSRGIHGFSILMVAAGSTLSAFWILAANSWQQTPAGYILRNGRLELTSLWDAIFNPSTMHRFFHTVDASLIVASFFMGGIAAHLLLKGQKVEMAKRSLRLAIVIGLIASLLQVVPFGHGHAKQVALTQPEKFAVFEAVYETQSHAPMVLFGLPSAEHPKSQWVIEIPGLLSWITFGDRSAIVKGLKDFPPDELPPRVIPFLAFRMMVGLGLYFVGIMLYGTVQLCRDKLWEGRRFLRVFVWSIPLPIAASQLGWIAAEVGRQPWIIYRVMKTADAVSPSLPAGNVLSSLILFGLLYSLLGILYLYIVIREVT